MISRETPGGLKFPFFSREKQTRSRRLRFLVPSFFFENIMKWTDEYYLLESREAPRGSFSLHSFLQQLQFTCYYFVDFHCNLWSVCQYHGLYSFMLIPCIITNNCPPFPPLFSSSELGESRGAREGKGNEEDHERGWGWQEREKNRSGSLSALLQVNRRVETLFSRAVILGQLVWWIQNRWVSHRRAATTPSGRIFRRNRR